MYKILLLIFLVQIIYPDKQIEDIINSIQNESYLNVGKSKFNVNKVM